MPPTRFSLSFLHQALAKANPPRAIARFWLACSLFFTTLYGCLGLRLAFSAPFVVQDDSRHHVFWTQRFTDPELLPGDLVADYFQSVAPVGYSNLYKFVAWLGVDPLAFNKILPFIVGILTAIVAFYFFLELIPIPAASFLGTLLFIQNAWMDDEIPSGTPRSFFYLLLLAFLYALSRRSLWGCIAALLLQGLFYPPTILLCAGTTILQAVRIEQGKLQFFSRQFKDYRFLLICLGVAVAVLLPYALADSPYEPLVTVAEAKVLPEFQEGGRTEFFRDNPLDYWSGGRSGLFDSTVLTPIPLSAALLFPVFFWLRLPLLRELTANSAQLLRLAIASFGTFAIAHIVLFALYLPSRYTQHSIRIILAFSAAVVLLAAIDLVLRWAMAAEKVLLRKVLAGLTVIIIGLGTLGYPLFLESFIDPAYVFSHRPELYGFLQQQPKDTLVASLSRVADNISTFGRRSVLFSREQSVPYHRGYYNRIERRIRAVIRAQYAPDLAPLQETIRQYGIDLWLLDRDAFDIEYFADEDNKWLRQFKPETKEAIAQLRSGSEPPAIVTAVDRCTVFADDEYVALGAACLLQEPQANPQ